jgi:toxin-antitoxin system PIN domain toxin
MKPYLLDTNILIALAWRNHVHHAEVTDWFRRKAAAGFRTCPITQTGFVRISSNSSFSSSAVLPADALGLLQRIISLPGHGFWPDDLPLPEAFAAYPVLGSHRQITDGYLLSLAVAHDGVLATLDRGIAPLSRGFPDRLELVAGN